MKRIAKKIANFLFNMEVNNAETLSKIIVGFALINILILMPDIYDLYGLEGYIQGHINDGYMYAYNPLLRWFIEPLSHLGISSDTGLLLIIGLYVFSLVFNFLRYNPFYFSIIAWIIHVMLVNSTYYFSYGADYFITFALFTNVLLNLDTVIKNEDIKKTMSSFVIRMVQIQMCFVYFFAGFGKVIGFDWLDGNAMWYVMNAYSPEFIKEMMPALIDYPIFFTSLCYWVLIIELFYPVLMFAKRFRKITLISVIAMHVGIMFIMGLYTFGVIMIILNIVAFGHIFEPVTFKSKKSDTGQLIPNMT